MGPDLLEGLAVHPDPLGVAERAVDRVAGTLLGVRDRIGYLCELGVSYLHLMPLLEPRRGPDDGSYAVRDYRQVRPDLGSMDDLAGCRRCTAPAAAPPDRAPAAAVQRVRAPAAGLRRAGPGPAPGPGCRRGTVGQLSGVRRSAEPDGGHYLPPYAAWWLALRL